MDNENSRLIDTMGAGNRLTLAWETIEGVIGKIETETHNLLMASIRSGSMDQLMVMRLEALDAIKAKFKSGITRGQRAANELARKGDL